jgi:hypothetical protein
MHFRLQPPTNILEALQEWRWRKVTTRQDVSNSFLSTSRKSLHVLAAPAKIIKTAQHFAEKKFIPVFFIELGQ